MSDQNQEQQLRAQQQANLQGPNEGQVQQQERERMAREQSQLRERQRHEQAATQQERDRLAGDAQARYANVDQPGKHPANMPDRRLDPERGPNVAAARDPHKTVGDLEDITGNPGHVGINPNAPTGFSERIAPATKTAEDRAPQKQDEHEDPHERRK
jgi:hypothetical protein